ncbi:SGNH/GDSL hydrolase family protein [Rufibacter hautae]|uniref:SGNH/GDSL hydrolase family protein n=1 Tax=Rufibacter hautae TaxID=2595005 RepID=A0A5B6TJE4_9BACT|nr:SGNH/GDSL hydrolase family protein [Rufibacter hautae]KAA3440531.1 SGNH/GDSL hydrolase family protein [Rufibacter hautae]
MKNIFYRLGAAALLSTAFLFSGCEPEFEEDITLSKGPLDFSKYVAVGNSLTAGYQDNGLYLEGQIFSYPNILANQFSFVGGGAFAQPLFTNEQRNGSGYLRLGGFSSTGAPILAPVTTNLAVRTDVPALPGGRRLTKFTGAIQNWGVPGISVLASAVPQYGGVNPYFERLLADAEVGQVSYVQKVVSTQPTFFSLWLGNNDVLGYATAGGVVDPANPFGGITPAATFNAIYSQLAAGLSRNKAAKGIVATIPDVRSVPFFTTVGPTFRAGLPAAVTAVVALTKSGANRTVIAKNDIRVGSSGTALFTLTSTAYLGLLGQPTGRYWRDQAKAKFPADAAAMDQELKRLLQNYQLDTTKMFGLSGENPLPSALVLDADEQAEIQAATTEYNTIIRNAATANDLAVFDAFTFFNSIQTPYNMNGVTYSPAFITGNLFSLDGVHPTPRGYAIIANEMIKEINRKYNSTVPTIDVTQFRAVLIP